MVLVCNYRIERNCELLLYLNKGNARAGWAVFKHMVRCSDLFGHQETQISSQRCANGPRYTTWDGRLDECSVMIPLVRPILEQFLEAGHNRRSPAVRPTECSWAERDHAEPMKYIARIHSSRTRCLTEQYGTTSWLVSHASRILAGRSSIAVCPEAKIRHPRCVV